MMILVLGDHREFFLLFSYWYQSYHSMSTMIFLRSSLQWDDTSRLRIFHSCETHKNFTYVQIYQAQNYFSPEEIILFFWTLPGSVHVLLNVADVRQCSKSDFPYLFVFMCLLSDLLSSFSIVALKSVIIIAWNERSFVLLGFPRHASLRDRSPESFEPYVTLDASKFAEQNNIWGSYSFLPRFSLESIPYSPDFLVYLKNFFSQIRCAARRDNMCLLSPWKKIRWRALSWDLFIGTNSCVKL